MGFFKNMVNSMTGNWADVNLQIGEGKKGVDIPVEVFVQNKTEAININNVYVQIRAVEEIHTNDSKICDKCSQTVYMDVDKSETVYENKYILNEAATLAPNQSLELKGKINIPEQLFSTYHGKSIRLRYEVIAGVDMSGNNPDSGWIELQVS